MLDGEKCIRCNKRFKFEELTVAPGGASICFDCAAKLNPKDEERRRCVNDGGLMSKELLFGRVLIDRCPSCGGVWLDGGEVEAIKGMVKNRDMAASLLGFFVGF